MYVLSPEYFDYNYSIIEDITDTKGLHELNQQAYFIEWKSMRAC